MPGAPKTIGYGDALSTISVLARMLLSVESAGISRSEPTLSFVYSLVVCETRALVELWYQVRTARRRCERQISLVGIRSTNTGV